MGAGEFRGSAHVVPLVSDAAPEDVTVRRFDPSRDEHDALRDLHARALRDAGTDPTDVPATDDLDRVETVYADGTFLVGVDAAGGVVAMGGFRPLAGVDDAAHEAFDRGEVDPERAVELFRIAVDPARQGEGLGGRLLDELERRARGAGVDWVVLTTAARQADGVGLYRSRDYREVDRIREGPYELVRFGKRV